MKKLSYLFIALACAMFVGCSSCHQEKGQPDADTIVIAELVVENTVSVDREWMFANYGENYNWYETCILLKDYMDEECDGTIEGISNVFQHQIEKDENSDSEAIISAYANGKHEFDAKTGIWVGDFPLNEENIKVSYKEAFDKMMASNYQKPHSRHCVLRREVGPKPNVAPQYIFGNQKSQLYVDATTGDVTDKNPAY